MMLGFTGCGDSKTGSSDTSEISGESKDELKEFRIGAGGADDAPTMEIAKLAYDKGYLEEELNVVGYTAKISAFMGTGSEINEALASGEPTLAGVSFYEKVVNLQKEYNTKHITIENTIQTNGMAIDEEWAEFLAKNNFLVGQPVADKCKTFPHKSLCRGGCRRWRETTADSTIGLNYLCPAYEIFFAHTKERINVLRQYILKQYGKYIP